MSMSHALNKRCHLEYQVSLEEDFDFTWARIRFVCICRANFALVGDSLRIPLRNDVMGKQLLSGKMHLIGTDLCWNCSAVYDKVVTRYSKLNGGSRLCN